MSWEIQEAEIKSLSSKVRGPISYLPVSDEDDNYARDSVSSGHGLKEGSFSVAAGFSDKEQNELRLRFMNLLMDFIGTYSSDTSNDPRLYGSILYAEQQLAECQLVESAYQLSNPELDPKSREDYMNILNSTQNRVYGVINNRHLAVILGQFNAITSSFSPRTNEERTIRQDFLSNYEFVSDVPADEEGVSLDKESAKMYKEYMVEMFDPHFDAVTKIFPDYDIADIPKMCQAYLMSRGFIGAVSENASNLVGFRVQPGSLKLQFATKKKAMPREDIYQKIIHEVERHLRRAYNGFLLDYPVLQTGLAGNKDFEEGSAILDERIYRGKTGEPLGRESYRYLTVAYADGKIDNKRHTEEESRQFILNLMAIVAMATTNTSPVEAFESVSGEAYDHTKRAFRGMPSGAVMRSNISYYSGYADSVDYYRDQIQHGILPREHYEWISIGKFHPLLSSNLDFLNRIGMPTSPRGFVLPAKLV